MVNAWFLTALASLFAVALGPMGDNMRIYFVRHGQSLGNAARVLLGHTDLDLSELGYRQARATADAMRDFQIDIIYSSDLKRAYNTALAHAEPRGIPVLPDERLRESYLGEWENKSADWCAEHYPVDFSECWIKRFGTFRFPGGESTGEVGERIYRRVLEICRENPEKNILIVSHSVAIRSFFVRVMGASPEEAGERVPSPANASYSVCEFDGERITVLEYSVDGHLAEIGITKLS